MGGILAGKDLIHAAEVRSTIGDIEKLHTAIHTFQLKYNCLPGDCANATDYFGTLPSGCPLAWDPGAGDPTGTCNGNGDGRYLPWNTESTLAGDHLVKAQLWSLDGINQLLLIKISGVQSYVFANIFTNNPWTSGAPVNGHDGTAINLESLSGTCLVGYAVPAADGRRSTPSSMTATPRPARLSGWTGSYRIRSRAAVALGRSAWTRFQAITTLPPPITASAA